MNKCLIVLVLLTTFSCRNKDNSNPSPSDNRQYVNNWILANMREGYYWNTTMPQNPDTNKAPQDFFKLLLNSNDRFSWLQENYVDLMNSLKGISKQAGYEFLLYRLSDTGNDLIGHIVYVKPNTSASQLGLKRGDVFTHINGTKLTMDNYKTVLDKLSENHTITYQKLNIETQTFGAPTTINLTTQVYQEDPNFLSKVITGNNHKVGYFVYNFFSDGPAQNDFTYNTKMDDIFASFKSEGITDLILDFRYNSGGSEIASKNLASLIGVGVDDQKVFLKKEYNTILTEELKKSTTTNPFQVNFLTKSQNVGSQLGANTVYILTSARTASASELIINCLRPYMNVVLIGNTTYGKNVGSVTIYDTKNTSNKWGIQPIIMKAYNSLDQSNYSQGFTPDIADLDNSLIVYQLGDPKERLLSLALNRIYGVTTVARTEKPYRYENRESVSSSIDFKPGSYNLITDIKLKL